MNEMNSHPSSIPILKSPTDTLTHGLNSNNLAAQAVHSHPIDQMQRSSHASSHNSSSSLDLDSIRRLYGSALAMRLSTERHLASTVGGRLPGLDAHVNSKCMLDTLTGEDVSVEFGDYLNVVQERVESSLGGGGGRKGGDLPHGAMEVKLGL